MLRLRDGMASPAVELWRRGEGPRVVLRGEGSAAMAAVVARTWGEGLEAMAAFMVCMLVGRGWRSRRASQIRGKWWRRPRRR